MNRYLVAVLVTAAAVVLRLALAKFLGPTAHPHVVLFCGAAVATRPDDPVPYAIE